VDFAEKMGVGLSHSFLLPDSKFLSPEIPDLLIKKMADNPFESPQVSRSYDPAIIAPRTPIPTLLNVLLIFLIMIGVFGILGSCMGTAGMAISLAMDQSQMMEPGQANRPPQEFQRKVDEMNRRNLVPNAILIGLNFILAPLILTGAIGCLARKRWGHGLLTKTLIAAMVFVVIRTAVGVFTQLQSRDLFSGQMAEAMKEVENQQLIVSLIGGFFWGTIIFAVIWGLFFLAFYAWSYSYLNKPQNRVHMGLE
jgi:hypothetical protein